MNNEKEKCPIWAQARRLLLPVLQAFILYLDDLLLIGGGCCLTAAAWDYAGRPAGLAAAGAWLCLLALVIARSRKGGGG